VILKIGEIWTIGCQYVGSQMSGVKEVKYIIVARGGHNFYQHLSSSILG
jgi:hypothetical protein